MKQILSFLIALSCFCPVSAQTQTDNDNIAATDTALLNIYKQLAVFPQEKIYIQTDKPYYIAGETAFYRLFLLDASFHEPFFMSRYVYVELIDQNNTVQIRQKLRPEEGMFYGALKLSEKMAQGHYKIRAYTRYMENTGIESFYSKPVFVIAENKEHLKMEMNTSGKDKTHTTVELWFVDAKTGKAANPKNVSLQLNAKKQKASIRKENGVFEFDLPVTDDDKDRRLYVEVMNSEDSVIFRQYAVVPYIADNIELTFYPEGGYLVEGQTNAIAFKALHKGGSPAEISGSVVAADGTRLAGLSGKHEGMGIFYLIPEKDKIYTAEYECGGKQYRTQLPDFKTNSFSLHTLWKSDKLLISVNREAGAVLPAMHLLVHCRGDILYSGEWNADKQTLSLEKDLLRSGVNHIILLSEDYYPLSERLVFCNRNDHLEPAISTDKKEYGTRGHAVMNFSLGKGKTDALPTNFAVSVTDDKEVQIDTTTNILTQILLESELKGRISNPASYFSNTPESESNADLLMMTHGWTRYDLPKAMRGELTVPKIEPETTQILTGQVKGGVIPRPSADIEVSIMSLQEQNPYFDLSRTDKKGLFRFDNFEFPDSTKLLVQALKGKKRKKGLLELTTDTVSYPAPGSFGFYQYALGTSGSFIEELIAETDWRYSYINGMRLIRLPEVVIMAHRKPMHDNTYNIEPDFFMSEDEIQASGAGDLMTLLSKLPYVTVRYRGVHSIIEVQSLGAGTTTREVTITVNGIDAGLLPDLQTLLSVRDIAEIHLINRSNKTFFLNSFRTVQSSSLQFGNNFSGGNGRSPAAIEIITKGGILYDRRPRFHFQSLMPLGYAVPVEFYSPKYDTPEALNGEDPDLRSTIFWKPNLVVDENGAASVDFYTADSNTSYSVVTEGVSSNGRLIYGCRKGVMKINQ